MIAIWIIRPILSLYALCTSGNIPWVKLWVRNGGPKCILLPVITILGIFFCGMGEGGSFPGHLPPATGTVERHVLGDRMASCTPGPLLVSLVTCWELVCIASDITESGYLFKVSGVLGERLQSQAFSVKLCAEKGILALPQTQPLTCKELAAGQGAFCCPDALKK